jgi:flagellar basal-body rod protein FlgB
MRVTNNSSNYVTMPIDINRALGIHAQALLLRARRAEVLAGNLANADTPNFKARDIDFRSALQAAQNQSSAAIPSSQSTHHGHIPLTSNTALANEELLYRQPLQASIDGNTVDTQKEHAEFMDNAVRYQASLSFLSGRLRSLLAAIRGE